MTDTTFVQIALAGETSVFVPKGDYTSASAYIDAYREISTRLPGEPHVFRIASIGTNHGYFAACAAFRWPYSYVDLYQPSADPLARLNTQPGTRFFDATKGKLLLPAGYDALHVGLDAPQIEFDEPSVSALQLAVWEFATSETLENATGFLRFAGLAIQHVAMITHGRGVALYFRPPAATPDGAA